MICILARLIGWLCDANDQALREHIAQGVDRQMAPCIRAEERRDQTYRRKLYAEAVVDES